MLLQLEGICFESIREKHLPWIYVNKSPEKKKKKLGKSQPCLFLYNCVYRLFWDLNPAIELEEKYFHLDVLYS